MIENCLFLLLGLFEFNIWLKENLPKEVYSLLKNLYRNTIKYPQEKRALIKRLKGNCDIWFIDKLLSKGVSFPHPYGIIISPDVEIGDNCTISQGVTIGAKNFGVPSIGKNVKIFANSVIIGNIKIGDNSIIGAGSIVLEDVPKNEVWAGNPAKFIKKVIKS